MKIFKKIRFKIKVYFWKRKINKELSKLTRNYDFSSAYPDMKRIVYYTDTDSIKTS